MAASQASLSAAEIQTLKASWNLWEINLRENGSNFFLAFFKAHLEYKNVFRIFRDMNVDELAESPKLRAHASIIMRNLTSVIDNLDEPRVMVEVLKKMAESHYPRGVRTKHFEDLFAIFNASMAATLKDGYDADTAKAWQALIAIMLAVLDKELVTRKQVDGGR